MTYEEAKTLPLNELLPRLLNKPVGEKCNCACKAEKYNNPMFYSDEDCKIFAEQAAKICKKFGDFYHCWQRIAYDRVMEACEKATQKKPNIEKKSGYSDFRCPSCNTKIIAKFKDDSYIGIKERYCHVCGQRLDWSSRK